MSVLPPQQPSVDQQRTPSLAHIILANYPTMNISVDISPSAPPTTNPVSDAVDRVQAKPPGFTSDVNSSLMMRGSVLKTTKQVAEKLEEKKKRRKKKWKKPKDKPTRPLSAYNLFFRSERSRMLGADAPSAELETLKKRVHCKTHGKIGFAEMARAIGANWKVLEAEKRKVFEDKARKEKERYMVELAAWKEAQKEKPEEQEESKGLDAMATAAMASHPIDSDKSTTKARSETGELGSPPRSVANEAPKISIPLLQGMPHNLDYIRALQDRQIGLSRLESSLMQYPSAAEASASALLQHFQSVNQATPSFGQRTNALPILEANRLSQLAASAYPANPLAAMRQLQYMSSNGFGTNGPLCR